MLKRVFPVSFCVGLSVLLTACGSSNHQDLKDYIAENKRRPPGKIKEAPEIEPYKAFVYDAYRVRSPFDRPISESLKKKIDESENGSGVEPDLNRRKQRLEQFDLSTLRMVGTLQKDNVLWALVVDPDGAVERIRRGDYMGKNNGKVVDLSENKIDLTEIVASGRGWLERPNVLELKTVGDE